MNVSPLLIHQTHASLSIRQTPGSFSIQQPKAEVDINNIPAELSIQKYGGDLYINQDRANAAYGIIDPIQMNARLIQKIKQQAIQAIGKIASDGNRMSNVHREPNALINTSVENSKVKRDYNYFTPPSTLNVDINYIPVELDINHKPEEVQVNITPRKPIINGTPAKVHIELQTYPSTHFEWTGKHIDFML